MSVDIGGRVAPGFEGVADAFARNFEEDGEVGAAVAVQVDGTAVVDAWAGVADPERGLPWAEDTVVTVFSSTKGATAVAAHLLVQDGRLDVDAPIASYWPEFAANGKGTIPVRWALSHRAGLADVHGALTLDDVLAWDPVVAAIAAQAPDWEPGSAHGYHARSYGWIVGELIRRVSDRTPGRFFAEEIAEPLGLDFWIGLPAEVEPRVARMLPAPRPSDPKVAELVEAFFAGDSLSARVLSGPNRLFAYDDRWNRRALRAAEMPSSNGIASARSLAGLYAAVLDGLLEPATVRRACEVQSDGPDLVLGVPTTFGLGFMLPPTLGAALGPGAFGHAGAGGSLGFADPAAGLAFGYVMNQMQLGVTGDRRSARLIDAVYAALR